MIPLHLNRFPYVLALALFACGPTDSGDANPGQGADSGTLNPPSSDAQPIVDGTCGAQTEEIPLVELKSDLLIVLDRSGSMDSPPGLIPLPFQPTKWDIMKDALNSIVSTYDTNIRFGLTAFPNGSSDICGITPGADVPVDFGQAASISSWLGSNSPKGSTPAHLALQNAANIFASLPSNPGGQYVLFATDGEPNCGGNPVVASKGSGTETVAAVQALAAQGVTTFVLGFGSPLGLDTGVLNDSAQAGGKPKPSGPPYYYEAADAASLTTALMEIAGGIVVPSCSFELAEVPDDPDLATVSVNGTAIPRDTGHNDGWDYHPDTSTITFFGAACDLVQAGNTNVSFVFGCPGPTID